MRSSPIASTLLPSRRTRRALAVLLLAGSALVGATALTGATALVDAQSPAPANAAIQGTAGPQSFADVVQAVSPAVVNIAVTRTREIGAPDGSEAIPPQFRNGPFQEFFRRHFGPEAMPPRRAPQERQGAGSGFVVDPDGYIVTNHHVIAGADSITVTLQDGRVLDARLVGTDPRTDLALIRVEADAALPFVAFGSSEDTRIGDWVIAVGNPFGLGGTVTAGILSARGRDLNAGPFDDFLQIDAPINRGNSGGPTFNADGEVIGVNSAIYSPNGGSVGIGFAIPSEIAEPVISQLRTDGTVTRGWIGVQIQTITPTIAQSLGLEQAEGALVADVVADGPAEAAGLAVGDIILRFGGQAVTEMRDLPRIVAGFGDGDRAEVDLLRNGRQQTVDLTVGTQPRGQDVASAQTESEPADPAPPVLGLELRPAPDGNGIIVAAVDPAGPAAQAGLRVGDRITQAGQEPITTPADLAASVQAAEQAERPAILVLVEREGRRQFIAVPFAQA